MPSGIWHKNIAVFQSTLPRRERLTSYTNAQEQNSFNPRSREGSDHVLYFLSNYTWVSIHAPAKGATFVPVEK